MITSLIRKCTSFKVTVISPDFPGKLIRHSADSFEEALDWARQYDNNDQVIISRYGKILAQRYAAWFIAAF